LYVSKQAVVVVVVVVVEEEEAEVVVVVVTAAVKSRDSAVDIVTGYGLDVQKVGVRVPVGARIFTAASPDRLWGPFSLLPNG
jgi:hypothetical protein